MPYKSQAQERWAHTASGMKALGGSNKVHEWDEASKGMKLPMYKAAMGGRVPEDDDMMEDAHMMAKEAALAKLRRLMDHKGLEGLKSLHAKPIAEVSMTKITPVGSDDDHDEADPEEPSFEFGKSWPSDGDDADGKGMEAEQMAQHDDEEEPSDDEKAKIAAKYHKWHK